MESIVAPPASESSSRSVFSPLLISMLGIVATSLAIIFYHFFLVQYCNRRRQRNPDAAAQPPPGAGGIDQKILQAIPVSPFSALKRSDTDQDECVVCLGELEDDDVARLLPNCKHAFHVSCIDQWLASHTSCPLCRSPVLASSTEDDENPSPSCSDSSTGGDASDLGSDVSDAIDNDGDGGSETSSSSEDRSFDLFCNCASLVLPPAAAADRRSSRLIDGLKRSVSMDQCLIAINLQRESERGTNCSSDVSTGLRSGGSCRTRSMGHFDRLSSKLLRSFSRLRIGNRNTETILPY